MALAHRLAQPTGKPIPLQAGGALAWLHPTYDFAKPIDAARGAMGPNSTAIAWSTLLPQKTNHLLPYNLERSYLLRVGRAPLPEDQWFDVQIGMGPVTADLMKHHMRDLRNYFSSEMAFDIPGAAAIILRRTSIIAIYEKPLRAFLVMDPAASGHDHLAEPAAIEQEFPGLFEAKLDEPLKMSA